MTTAGKPTILQNSLTSYNSSDPYQDSSSLISNLKQEQTPIHSDESQEEFDENDRFLEELEQENMLLEKELESLVQLKNSQQKEAQHTSLKSSNISEVGDLEKIDEKVEEEQRESYYYSNSEDENPGAKLKSRYSLKSSNHGSGVKQNDIASSFGESNMHLASSGFPRYKFEDGSSPQKERDMMHSSPLRTSHLDKSERGEVFMPTSRPESHRTSNNASARQKDKENVSANEVEPSTTDRSIKKKVGMSSGSNTKSKKSISPPKYEKMDKTSSLEQRLLGANKAIKALEGELKMKNDKIQDLTKEVEKKNKLIESQQANSLNGSQLQKSNQMKESMTAILRKKEKEMDKKMREQEILLTENKKYMTRLQELNAKLLAKVKELEEENLFIKKNQDMSSKLKAYEDENKRWKEKAKGFEQENIRLVNQCGSQRERLQVMVEMYENFELKSEKFIMKNKSMTDTLVDLITKHHEVSTANEERKDVLQSSL